MTERNPNTTHRSSEESTNLLLSVCDGNREAADKLVPLVYNELRATAQRMLSRERVGHTLQPTALVNEVFMKLINQERIQWQGRAHFCAIAANFMRRILCDYARERSAKKRGGDMNRVTLNDIDLPRNDFARFDLVDLDETLTRLAELNPRHAQIVELRYFGGLTIEETAHTMDLSPSSVKNEWRMARTWIRTELESK